VVIITETNVPHAENISYFGDGHNEAHMVYNFTLPPLLMHSLHRQSVCKLTEWARSLKLPSDEVCFFNFTASHDGVGVRPLQGIVSDEAIEELARIASDHGGFVSMRDNGDGTRSPYEINCNYFDFATSPDAADDLRVQRFMLTQAVMLAMPGVPGIYYHSLIGSENDRAAAVESGINRRINRAKLNADDVSRQLQEPGTIRSKVATRYRRLLAVRQNEAAFDPFGDAEYDCQGPVFVIRRHSDSGNLWAVHNFSDAAAPVGGLPNQLTDVVTGETVDGTALNLQPFEYRWLK
jgi:sucrose phosphorylase